MGDRSLMPVAELAPDRGMRDQVLLGQPAPAESHRSHISQGPRKEEVTVHPKTDLAKNARSAAFNRHPPAIRIELDQQRRFRIEQLRELTTDAAEAIGTADDSRLQVTRALKRAAESALTEIEGALRRLEQGTYGTCQRCAEPIPWERLKVLPATGLCTPCQWTAELNQAGSRRSQTPSSSRIR